VDDPTEGVLEVGLPPPGFVRYAGTEKLVTDALDLVKDRSFW